MARRSSVAYRDPTASTAIRNVMRTLPQQTHADLGLGYPPRDDTEDLRRHSVADSKKPPTADTAKHPVEGSSSHPHQEADVK